MAFSVKLTGYSKKDSAVLLEVEPPWWDSKEVLNDPDICFVHTNETGSYSDYDADLDKNGLRRLHDRFKQTALRMMENESWREAFRPIFDEIESAIGSRADQFLRFHVCVFEWESGM